MFAGFRLSPRKFGRSAFDVLGIHPDDFPDVAVGILEAAAVHEAVILRRVTFGTAGLERLVDEGVDGLTGLG